MKLTDIIIFILSVTALVIGIYETMVLGLKHSYWIFMISISLLLWYKYRKDRSTKT